jgi:hypothetical protein
MFLKHGNRLSLLLSYAPRSICHISVALLQKCDITLWYQISTLTTNYVHNTVTQQFIASGIFPCLFPVLPSAVFGYPPFLICVYCQRSNLRSCRFVTCVGEKCALLGCYSAQFSSTSRLKLCNHA